MASVIWDVDDVQEDMGCQDDVLNDLRRARERSLQLRRERRSILNQLQHTADEDDTVASLERKGEGNPVPRPLREEEKLQEEQNLGQEQSAWRRQLHKDKARRERRRRRRQAPRVDEDTRPLPVLLGQERSLRRPSVKSDHHKGQKLEQQEAAEEEEGAFHFDAPALRPPGACLSALEEEKDTRCVSADTECSTSAGNATPAAATPRTAAPGQVGGTPWGITSVWTHLLDGCAYIDELADGARSGFERMPDITSNCVAQRSSRAASNPTVKDGEHGSGQDTRPADSSSEEESDDDELQEKDRDGSDKALSAASKPRKTGCSVQFWSPWGTCSTVC